MEPPGGQPLDRERQLVLRAPQSNSQPLSTQPQTQQQQTQPLPAQSQLQQHQQQDQQPQPQPQQQQHQQLVPFQPVKPTSLNLSQKPQPQPQTQQLINIATSPASNILTSTIATTTVIAITTTATTSISNNNASQPIASTTATMATTTTATTTATTFPAAGAATTATGAGTSPALASTATAISATTQAATAFSGSSVGHHLHHHQHQHHQHQHHQHQHQHHQHQHHHQHHVSPQPQQQQQHQQQQQLQPHVQQHQHSFQGTHNSAAFLGGSNSGGVGGGGSQQQTIEKLSRPMAFDRMEALVREMQDAEHGVPVRQQKMFLTSIPYAFMGYDLIEWLMDRLAIEESEALNISNQLCLHGYFFPVNDSKTLTVKDDSSLYRFQTPYYWPWQHKTPDNVEYAIYLAKRSLRNKQRHALEDYESEAMTSLHKNLKGKWEFISMQADEQVRLAKERKKGDKIVGDSQERAYWRVHRPPPGQFTPLEPCPVPSRDRQGLKPNKKKTVDDIQREVDYLKKSLNRTRMKMSQACESLVTYSETFAEFDFFLQPALPSNPWVTEDITFWQLNNTFVDVPTEKRVKRWAISIEELVSDPTGLHEFTSFLEKEYSHENIRFWIAVNRLRRSAHSQVARKVNDIFEEFLKPGAPCEINIDGKTMESVLKGLKNPSRFTFDSASEHIYMLLLKKDCYPRFIRSDHYKRLLETGIQPSHKKRFFNFGGVSGAKKKMTAALSSQPNLGDMAKGGSGAGGTGSGSMQAPPPGNLSRRRGSDRSLTGSAHELAVIGVNKDNSSKVPHSHSQSNLSEIPYREAPKPLVARLETTVESASSAVCPWDEPSAVSEPTAAASTAPAATAKLSVCPWEQRQSSEPISCAEGVGKTYCQRLTSTSSDISDVSDRMQRNLGIRHQNTVDSGEAGVKRLMPSFTEQRRASVSFTQIRLSDYQFGRPSVSAKTSTTPSPTVGSQGSQDSQDSQINIQSQCQSRSQSQSVASANFPPLFVAAEKGVISAVTMMNSSNSSHNNSNRNTNVNSSNNNITKDPPSLQETEIKTELQNSEAITSAATKLPVVAVLPMLTSSPSQMSISISTSTPTPIPIPTPTPTPTATTTIATATPTPPPVTKITPPPEERIVIAVDSRLANCTPSERESSKIDTHTQTAVAKATDASGTSVNTEREPDAEVSVHVKEVQIELIETRDFEGGDDALLQLEQLEVVVTTPTIQVEEAGQPIFELAEALTNVIQQQALQQDLGAMGSGSAIEAPLFPTPIPTPMTVTVSTNTTPPVRIDSTEEEYAAEEIALQIQESTDAFAMAPEELSPTTDEYQEGLQFGADAKDVYDYDIVDTDDAHIGYIPPAPTPAPSMAPLAELDLDTVDDEPCEDIMPLAESTTTAATTVESKLKLDSHMATSGSDEVRRRRKKRNSESKKMSSLDDKDRERAGTSTAAEGTAPKTDTDRNTVCPWEDENVTTSDGTFVKTYATLGYL